LSDWREGAKKAINSLVRAMQAGAERKFVYQLVLALRSEVECENSIRSFREIQECFDGRTQIVCERAYRRGYSHGYSAGADNAIRDKISLQEMIDFQNMELHDWERERLAGLEFVLKPPPVLKKKTRKNKN
jgi:hypothetical protein